MTQRSPVPVCDIDLATIGASFRDLPRLRSAREHYLSAARLTPLVRTLIQRSWSRSALFNVPPDTRRLERVGQPRLERWVRDAADPILQALHDRVQTTAAIVILTDAEGAIIDRRGDGDVRRQMDQVQAVPSMALGEDAAGTNAIGTAIEEGVGVQIWSSEHFIEAFQGFACTAIPIRHPLSHKLLAILDITTRARDMTETVAQFLARMVAEAKWEMENALYERLTAREQALLWHYLQEVRSARSAVVAMDGRTTITSAGAVQLLHQDDHALLWACAEESRQSARPLERRLTLSSGRVARLVALPKYDGGDLVGVVLRLDPLAAEPPPPSARRPDAFAHLVGRSPGFRRALQLAQDAIPGHLSVCIEGGPGTGKYALAQALATAIGGSVATIECLGADMRSRHWLSHVQQQLAAADVAIFRHVDTLHPAAQRALIGLLDGAAGLSCPRLIATAHSLAPAPHGKGSALRQELLDRVAALPIKLPPLNERREDIPLLVHALLDRQESGRRRPIGPKALHALVRADWPGNVRQLENTLQRALTVARGLELTVYDLPAELLAAGKQPQLSRLEEAEVEALRRALHEARGNRAKAAALLGIGRSTLYRKLEAYHLTELDSAL